MKTKEMQISRLAHNIMGAGTIVKGEISTSEDFRIDGIIEGNVICKGKVVLGPQASITGNITCSEADLMGKMNGNLDVQGKLIFRSSLILNGDLSVQKLEIEPGA
ncbi:polymer-forming cytoskeletal protein, partial [Bacteroidales bacterium OttesenSCG-928-M11]|nr:polymer-forming cytoskeletal protein [Bacteroidales bacterium OttesenSCG-928-M11]